MGTTWAGRLSAAFGVLLIPYMYAARGGEPAAPASAPPAAASTAPPASSAPATSDSAAALAQTNERLGQLGKLPEKETSSTTKALKGVLEDRVRLLKAFDEAAKAHHSAAHPEPSPEAQAAEWKTDLERVKTLLEQSAKAPVELLPAAFLKPAEQVSDAVRVEMKEAIDEARNDLKDWKSKLDKLRSDAARKSSHPVLAALQAERDKTHQRVAALPPRRAEREAALAAAKTPDERVLAGERLTNFEWEARGETERLLGEEARIALEARRADLEGLHLQVCDAHVRLATRGLELMQARYKSVTEHQELDLRREAATEQKRAAKTDDPLEQFHARWKAELLELKLKALRHENALASSPYPSLEEQRSLADRADVDFANVKHLLDDGLVSQLDALRLNNDFRRIGPLRSRIISHELAASARQLTDYENALSSVELDLINDHRADEYEHETLLERIPHSRHKDAKALFSRLDREHNDLLNRNRTALEKLAARAEQTHSQVLRRLRILDDQYGFIRTHIFWVRDQEPIGAATLVQGQRDVFLVGKSLVRLALEVGDRTLWGRVSVEFVAGLLALPILIWPSLRLRRSLLRKSGEARRPSGGVALFRGALVGVGYSLIVPVYLGVLAYTARQAPWPRSLALPASASLAMLAPAAFLAGLVRWMLRPGGWAEESLQVPAKVTRQLRRAVFALVLAGIPLLLPNWLLDEGLIAPGGRPISAAALDRLMDLGFELVVWGVVFRLVRRRSPLVKWLLQFPERLGWLNRHRRGVCWSLLGAIFGVIALDAFGFSYTAGRLALGAGQGILLLGLCWGIYRMLLHAIEHHAWRWIRVRHSAPGAETPNDTTMPDDLANRLRRLAAYLVPGLGLVLAAWIWDVDWALFRVLGEQRLWRADADTQVTLGDFTKFAIILGLTVAAWRHMSTLFAVAVFPRMRDDPGVRFAVVTLCRYAVLGVGLLAGLSAIHLGLEKIGMVLAALGVGLGFGLQEIVSNFVCGIILLLERPIRVGDLVTVSSMTGKVDRINIRATTITNGDNQSMIVPNRAFITGDLVNWTLKDKVIRVSIRLKVAPGTDPDRVCELLLSLAREDADVMRNPLPASFMEDFSDSALNFVLHVHVPDPSLGSRVRHRLFVQIQRRFSEEEIAIPLPTHELRVHSSADASGRITMSPVEFQRLDPASPTPPAPRLTSQPSPSVPAAVEDCHRGVDE
jgi:potassium efflux system protein